MYSAYVLTQVSRDKLLAKFPPKYDRVIAHHVTYEFPADMPPPEVTEVKVIGRADTGDGLEALEVRVDGSTVRPDGGTYHITLSIDTNSNYSAKDSNELLARGRYTLCVPFPVDVTAEVLK